MTETNANWDPARSLPGNRLTSASPTPTFHSSQLFTTGGNPNEQVASTEQILVSIRSGADAASTWVSCLLCGLTAVTPIAPARCERAASDFSLTSGKRATKVNTCIISSRWRAQPTTRSVCASVPRRRTICSPVTRSVPHPGSHLRQDAVDVSSPIETSTGRTQRQRRLIEMTSSTSQPRSRHHEDAAPIASLPATADTYRSLL